MAEIEARLGELGITLPKAAAPVANYVAFVLSGDTLVVSGQLALGADGKLDAGPQGQARGGDLGRRRPRGRAASAPSTFWRRPRRHSAISTGSSAASGSAGSSMSSLAFIDMASIMNGASDLMVEVLGDKGRHARSTIGVASLPCGLRRRGRGAVPRPRLSRPDVARGLARRAPDRASRPPRSRAGHRRELARRGRCRDRGRVRHRMRCATHGRRRGRRVPRFHPRPADGAHGPGRCGSGTRAGRHGARRLGRPHPDADGTSSI